MARKPQHLNKEMVTDELVIDVITNHRFTGISLNGKKSSYNINFPSIVLKDHGINLDDYADSIQISKSVKFVNQYLRILFDEYYADIEERTEAIISLTKDLSELRNEVERIKVKTKYVHH